MHMNSNMHDGGRLTLVGWTNFALYTVAALLAFRAALISCRRSWPSETRRIWFCVGVLLAALGLNKPLDLQTWLIELGRQFAGRENLSAHRTGLHVLFFLVFAAALVALFIMVKLRFSAVLGSFARRLPLAAGGCLLVCAYIVIRAASITHVDLMLGVDLERIPFLWLLEACGLLLIIIQSLRKPNKLKS